MGLSYGEHEPGPAEEVDEAVRRRALFGVASVALFGAPVLGEVLELPVRPATPTPLPSRLVASDVEVMRNLTAGLRGVARQYGGCADVVTGTARRSLALLSVPATDQVGAGMRRAVGELHTLAGWCCVDSGLADAAGAHFAKAMQLGDLSAALRHAGIQMCDEGAYNDGLKAFQLALVNADDPWLHLETALPLAAMGQPQAAMSAAAKGCEGPPVDGFDAADMDYSISRVYHRLGDLDRAEALAASSVGKWSKVPDAKRDRVEADIALAAIHIEEGTYYGPTLASRAIDSVMPLRSVRSRAKLMWLIRALETRGGSTCDDLARQARLVYQRV